MESRKCLLLEDSREEALILEKSLTQLGLYCLRQAFTPQEAISALRSEKFDLMFVDIQLNGASGLEFLESHTNLPPAIVISSHPEYAINTYDVEAVADFVPKPYTSGRLRRAINRAIGSIYQDNAIVEKDFAFFKSGRSVLKFAYTDIDYIQAYGVYSKVYRQGTYTLVNESISNLALTLPAHLFRRVHKSYIVSLKKITGYDYNFFHVTNLKVPIGVTYRDSLKALFRIFGDDSL